MTFSKTNHCICSMMSLCPIQFVLMNGILCHLWLSYLMHCYQICLLIYYFIVYISTDIVSWYLFCQQTIEYWCLSCSQGQLVIQWVPSIVVTLTLYCAAHCQCPVWGALQKQATCSIVSKCVLDLLHLLKIAHQIAVEPPCKTILMEAPQTILAVAPAFICIPQHARNQSNSICSAKKAEKQQCKRRSSNPDFCLLVDLLYLSGHCQGTTIQHHAYVPCHWRSNILLVTDYVHLSLLLPSDENDSMLVVFLTAACSVLHVLWNVMNLACFK
jgi:hypothetical protein